MTEIRKAVGAFAATLLLTLLLAGTANAGLVWCVKDPIFEIDGRIVRVQDFVPVANASTPLHFVLYVSEEATATWRVPEGETLVGSVTIATDRDLKRNTARLTVSGEGPVFRMQLYVSGAGLRADPFDAHGSSRGMRVTFKLDRSD